MQLTNAEGKRREANDNILGERRLPKTQPPRCSSKDSFTAPQRDWMMLHYPPVRLHQRAFYLASKPSTKSQHHSALSMLGDFSVVLTPSEEQPNRSADVDGRTVLA